MERRAAFLRQARSFGDHLHTSALWSGDRCTWLGFAFSADGSPGIGEYGTLGPNMYDGLAGVVRFLCELYRLQGEPRDADLIQAALRQCLALLEREHAAEVHSSRGYFTGLGGIAHVLADAGNLLESRWLLDGARHTLQQLSSLPSRPSDLDVIGGNAGMIAPLLDLADWLGDRASEKMAQKWAEEIIDAALQTDAGWAWKAEDVTQPLTGFAHGAAGFGWALAVAHAAFGDPRFLAGAEAAFRYEDSLFEPSISNWPDLREEDAPELDYAVRTSAHGNRKFMVAWCHGAAGIGLARAAVGDEEGVRRALISSSAALTSRLSEKEGTDFSLCHGVLGILEFLLEADAPAHPTLQRIESIAEDSMAALGVDIAQWPGGMPGGPTPSLMLGAAGMALHYLRLVDSSVISPVLLPGSSAWNWPARRQTTA